MLLVSGSAAIADTITVFVAGAAKHAMEEIVPAFERATGHKVQMRFDTVGALRDRVIAGETPDLVVLSTAAITQMAEKGKASSASLSLGRTGVGLAVPHGQPIADISTPEKLADFLKAASSIGYADPARGATAGTQFRKTIEALSLAEPLAPKLKVYPFGVEVIAALGKGELGVGVSQATEIVSAKSVSFVGFLPDPHQVWTEYRAALLKPGAPAQALLDAMGADSAKPAFAHSGFMPAR